MRLGVNIDHIATVRQARRGAEPDPLHAIGLVERAGADGIVCHLREDRRHILDRDLRLIRGLVSTHLNLEMAATEEMVRIALDQAPDMVTLVPEKREEITTEGGLNLKAGGEELARQVKVLRNHGIVVSVFIDPDLDNVREAKRLGVQFVELHTGDYAEQKGEAELEQAAERIREAAIAARRFGLRVSAGHGLNYHNVARIAAMPEIEELNIGHSIISRAIFTGLEAAVRDMLRAMGR